MKLDQESLAKNRFWICYGILLPLIFVAMIALGTEVSGANDSERTSLEKHKQELQAKESAKLKNAQDARVLLERANELKGLQVKIWEQAWNFQKDLFTWPQGVEEIADKDFGAEIPAVTCGKYAQQQYYNPQVEELGKMFKTEIKAGPETRTIDTVQFKGGPSNVIIHVPGKPWKKVPPSSEEVWLAQEDIWLQRELFRALREAIHFVVRFESAVGPAYKTDTGPGEKARAHFTNPYWHLDLVLAEKGNKYFLRGVIRNKSSRQLPIGRIYFNVQVKPDGTSTVLPVEGEPLGPGGEWKFKDVELPGLLNPEGLFGVTQICEVRDSPIKRIDQIVIGEQSHRYFGYETRLLPMRSRGKEPEKKADPMAKKEDPKLDPRGGPAGTARTENQLLRERYYETTTQVRRIPFGLVLLVDQAHVPQVLAALANSKVRIQTTQVTWQHFRDKLDGERPGGPPRPGPAAGKEPEEQPASNLVELTVYGIASMYERNPAPPAPKAPAEESGKGAADPKKEPVKN